MCFAFTAKSAETQIAAPAETQHYIGVIKEHMLKDYKGVFKPAKGYLKHPFITPGNASYQNQLWDWDSWLTDIAVRQILLDEGSAEDKQEALKHEQGCVLNFLDAISGSSGYIPIVISSTKKNFLDTGKDFVPWSHNMHKPCLAQHAAFLVKLNGGDAEWLRDQFPRLQAFVNCYHNNYRDKATGLYYWQTDECIGVDNDPCTFYRPDGSSASILLNCFMYKELEAVVYLAGRLNMSEIGGRYRKMADELLQSIHEHCWDPRDSFYYSVDLNLRPVVRPAAAWQIHMGQPRSWDCLIQRLGVWSGFLAMWAGVATPEQAKQMVQKNFMDTNTFNAPYGIRSLSKMEKMYSVRATSNPSNWLGPIWINVNYFVFRGLIKYGYNDEARNLAEKTIKLLGMDYEKSGTLHEFYLPDNGEPVMNSGFQSWNLLVLNMIAWYEGKPCVEEF